jgi:hypothetical protein
VAIKREERERESGLLARVPVTLELCVSKFKTERAEFKRATRGSTVVTRAEVSPLSPSSAPSNAAEIFFPPKMNGRAGGERPFALKATLSLLSLSLSLRL